MFPSFWREKFSHLLPVDVSFKQTTQKVLAPPNCGFLQANLLELWIKTWIKHLATRSTSNQPV